MTTFFRFPHTPHLIWLGKEKPRDDKILSSSERDKLLSYPLVVEEKVDGANLGFSLDQDAKLTIQNRGQYLSSPHIGQFKKLSSWLSVHEEQLFDALEENLIAFGEWCAARHSLEYTDLPDWWLLFDIYDKKSGCFFSTHQRKQWAEKANVTTISQITAGCFDIETIQDLLKTPSHYRDGNLEGIILRHEEETGLVERAKLVRPEFTQAIDNHWSRNRIEWNKCQFASNWHSSSS